MTCIVDASYLTYRAYCAGGTDAVHKASVSTLLDLLAHDPDVWLAWECPGGRGLDLRRAIYPDYKSRREPKPPEYHDAVRVLQDAMRPLGISQAWPDEGEADDVAWTLTYRALRHHRNVLLWSRDKDWLQLLYDPSVSMVLPATHGKQDRLVSVADVPSILGVPSGLVASYLALAGDPSDDIPGMPRIGAKRAAELLAACPALVALTIAGEGDQAVAEVATVNASLAGHAQAVADRPKLLGQMLDLVLLREVELVEQRGQYHGHEAEQALATLGCPWAVPRLAAVSWDDWGDTTPTEPEDDWSE